MTREESAAASDMTREADFQIGALKVSPSTSRVSSAGREQRLQPRVMEVLVLLAKSAGRTVTRDELIDACWAGRFVSENAVNRVLAQVRALSRLADPPPFVLETLPKLGVRLIAQAPPATGEAGPNSHNSRALALAAAVVVAVALGVGWLIASGRVPALPQNGRVEVAGFQPGAEDPALRRAATLASDTLMSVLSRSGVAMAGSGVREGGPGAELRVAGAVSRAGTDYAFDARIVDRRSGLVLWTDRILLGAREMERSPGEPAATIGAVLTCALDDRKAAKTRVTNEAFSLYLYTCAGIFLDDGQRMLTVARRLVKAAPRFANAHAMHAIAAARVASATQTPELAAAFHREAKAAAETALRLDPRTAKAYCGLALNEGVLADRLHHNWAAEEGYVRKALALDPDLAPARNEYATLLVSTGRLREAVEFLRASSVNENPRLPRDPRLATLLAAQGDLAAARDELARAEARDRVSRDDVRRIIAFWWEDPKLVLRDLQTLSRERRAVDRRCFTPYLEALAAHRGEVQRGLPAGCDDISPNTRVRMLARQGDVDGAFAAMKGRMPGGPLLLYYPEMRALRADPRFWHVANGAGLVAYWRRSGRWPDFCAEPGQDCARAAVEALGAAGKAAAVEAVSRDRRNSG